MADCACSICLAADSIWAFWAASWLAAPTANAAIRKILLIKHAGLTRKPLFVVDTTMGAFHSWISPDLERS